MIKNNARIVRHLQRIFMYGKGGETVSVRQFLDWLRKRTDPETGKPYSVADSTFYSYMQGHMTFPVDLLPLLLEYTLDLQMLRDYGLTAEVRTRAIKKIEMLLDEIEERKKKIVEVKEVVGLKSMMLLKDGGGGWKICEADDVTQAK